MMTQIEYEAALVRVEVLMGLDPTEGSPEGNELTALVDQVLEYELQWWPNLFPQEKEHANQQT